MNNVIDIVVAVSQLIYTKTVAMNLFNIQILYNTLIELTDFKAQLYILFLYNV